MCQPLFHAQFIGQNLKNRNSNVKTQLNWATFVYCLTVLDVKEKNIKLNCLAFDKLLSCCPHYLWSVPSNPVFDGQYNFDLLLTDYTVPYVIVVGERSIRCLVRIISGCNYVVIADNWQLVDISHTHTQGIQKNSSIKIFCIVNHTVVVYNWRKVCS